MNERINDTIYRISKKLWKTHESIQAEWITAPLGWYIFTGRASMEFVNRLLSTSEREKLTIAKRLAKHYGCDEAAINSVCQYLGFNRG